MRISLIACCSVDLFSETFTDLSSWIENQTTAFLEPFSEIKDNQNKVCTEHVKK